MKTPIRTTTLLALLAAALLAGCGGDEPPGNATDRAFVAQMIPHHEMAVEMAAMAADRARRPEVTRLAGAVTRAQEGEIARLRAVADDLGVDPAAGEDHGAMTADARTLGLSMDAMGMSMDMAALMRARSFDRAFVADMIPHHEGAIRMARAELAEGEEPRLRRLAEEIVRGQEAELAEMARWRATWAGRD